MKEWAKVRPGTKSGVRGADMHKNAGINYEAERRNKAKKKEELMREEEVGLRPAWGKAEGAQG